MNTKDSLKPSGPWEVRRGIKVPALSHAADALAVERAISTLPGVRQVSTELDKRKVVVRYDASRLSYHTIVDALENAGFPPLINWWCRIKGNWYEYADNNAQENANTPPSACCNKPPK